MNDKGTHEIRTSKEVRVEGATAHDTKIAQINSETILSLAQRIQPRNEHDVNLVKANNEHEIARLKLMHEFENEKEEKKRNRSAGTKFLEDYLPIIAAGISIIIAGAIVWRLDSKSK